MGVEEREVEERSTWGGGVRMRMRRVQVREQSIRHGRNKVTGIVLTNNRHRSPSTTSLSAAA